MSTIKAFTLLLFITLVSVTQSTYAQPDNYYKFRNVPYTLKSFELEYSYPMIVAEYSRDDTYIDESGNKQSKSYNMTVNSEFSYGMGLGFGIPAAKLGSSGQLVIPFGVRYNFNSFNFSTPVLQRNGEYAMQEAFILSTINAQLALMAGLDFRFGCDGPQDRRYKFGGTIGAGAYPYYNFAMDMGLNYNNVANLESGILPYVKGELAFFAGICIKLRATATFGDMTIYKGTATDWDWTDIDDFRNGRQYNVSLIGKSNLNFSLIFMPMSWMWKKTAWHNTY